MTFQRRRSDRGAAAVRGMLAGLVPNPAEAQPKPGVDEAALTAVRTYATTTGAEPLTYRSQRQPRRATRPVTTLGPVADAA